MLCEKCVFRTRGVEKMKFMTFAPARMKKRLHPYRGETKVFHFLNTPCAKMRFAFWEETEFGKRKTNDFSKNVSFIETKVGCAKAGGGPPGRGYYI